MNFTNVAAAKGGRRSHVVHSADARPTPRTHKKGSSRNPGERGADLEEEVLLVAVPVSAALDD
ncbi:hypothetical protein, partial [Burkholderia pseudomallei]|uniref:hypothetical protein n=1 Tax=Burkholderia pseudomallei TaxID=28450 RepID=UPI001F23DD79